LNFGKPPPPVAVPAAPVAAAPAPVGAAPVGGAAAPANPAAVPAAVNPAPAAAAPVATTPPTQANPVTTVNQNTLVGGVTKQVPVVFTQTFAGSLTSVAEVRSVGMGTLTGSVGLVKSGSAKTGGVGRVGEGTAGMGGWMVTVVVGGMVVGGYRVWGL